MEKFVGSNEEIIYLDAELLDDDDEAPIGDLVVHEKDATENAQAEVAVVDDATPAVDEPAEEVASEEAPAPVAVEEITPAEEEVLPAVQTEALPVEEEAPIVETVAPVEATEVEAAAAVEEAPAQVEVQSIEDEVKEEIAAENVEIQAALASEPVVEEKPVKAPTKKPAPKKKVEEKDIWSVAPVVAAKPEKKAPIIKNNTNDKEEIKPVAEKKEIKKTAAPAKETAKPVAKAEKAPATKAAPAKAEKAPAKAAPAKAEKAPAAKAAPAKAEKAPVAKAAPAKAVKEEVKETVLIEGEGKIHGKYVIKKTANGFFVFKLYSSNHRVIAIGAQPYKDIKSCRGGITSVINNAEKAPIENQTLKKYEIEKCPKWEVYLDKRNEFRLRLIASNGNIVATTNDGYLGIDGAKNGIAAIARASKGCSVVRNDNLW